MENDLKVFEAPYPGGSTVGWGDYYGFDGGLKGGFAGGKVVKVIDEFDTPMSFVNVRVKGRETAGSTTNASGTIDINFAAPGDTIVFSFVGYGTVELPFDKITEGQTVRMVMTTEELPEVVITKPATTTTTTSLPQTVTAETPKKINWLRVAGITIAAMAVLAILTSSSKPRKVNA